MSSSSTQACRTPYFGDTSTGRMKKQIWEAGAAEIDAILAEYGIPSPSEWGQPGCYIRTSLECLPLPSPRQAAEDGMRTVTPMLARLKGNS